MSDWKSVLQSLLPETVEKENPCELTPVTSFSVCDGRFNAVVRALNLCSVEVESVPLFGVVYIDSKVVVFPTLFSKDSNIKYFEWGSFWSWLEDEFKSSASIDKVSELPVLGSVGRKLSMIAVK